MTLSVTNTDAYQEAVAELVTLRAHHSDRVTGLLDANNREVERRRRAEGLLRKAEGHYRYSLIGQLIREHLENPYDP
jgi:hypothetical protein